MTAPQLDFIVYYVANAEDALAHFTETLNFERFPQGDGPQFYQLLDGNGKGFGILQLAEVPAGTIEVYYKIPDIAALHAQLTEKGAAVTPIKHRPFGAIFTLSAEGVPSLTFLQE